MKKVASFVVISALFFLFYLKYRNLSSNNKNDKLIEIIIAFKKAHGRFPARLEEIGIPTREEGPIYYELKSDGACMLWQGGVLGESEVLFNGDNQ